MKLKIGMLDHMNNSFRNAVFWISAIVPLIIQTKLLTALFKNNIETKEYSKFVET